MRKESLRVFFLNPFGDGPEADGVVGVTGEEGVSVGGPGQRSTLWSGGAGDVELELVQWSLLFQVPDLDSGADGGTEPVAVWRESEGVDGVLALKLVQVFVLVQVPQVGNTVLKKEE